ncbi:MAG: hypothetical protein ACREBC_19990, partial [Pyrinomonadaceae bacterium]
MISTSRVLRVFLIVGGIVLVSCLSSAQAQKRKPAKSADETAALIKEVPELSEGQLRLRLKDGTLISVEDAWESQQGVWYKQSGMT